MLRVPFNLYYAYGFENYSCGVTSAVGNVDLEWEEPFSSAADLENTPLLSESIESSDAFDERQADTEFNVYIRQFLEASEAGLLPERISQGSSGSYFIRNISGVWFNRFNVLAFSNS